MTVVYICGPFRAASHWGIVQNVRKAEALALKVWQAGMVALTPHLNTANFQGAAPDGVWLAGDLELLRRCDAVLLVEGWPNSEGAKVEVDYARDRNIPIFESLSLLVEWHVQVLRDARPQASSV